MELPRPASTEEPERKKLKMSTTASDDEDCALTSNTAAEPASDKKPRFKRRKIAIFFAYCGVGYQGMQKNPGAKTIEEDLEEALFQAGAVPEQDRGCPKRFDWARSARTDKGVSAVGQVVSGRFYIDPPGLVDRLNSILPLQIRIFGYKRVTASFNAKKFCDRRRYVYLIPVFALDPSAHRDRESVMASLGSENELVKCLECSERGRKVAGIMGKPSFENGDIESCSGISSNTGAENLVANSIDNCNNLSGEVEQASVVIENGTESGNGTSTIVLADSENEGVVMANGVGIVADTPILQTGSPMKNYNEGLRLESSTSEEKAAVAEKPKVVSGFSYGEKEKERFNGILKHYVGTHNFHNFTTRIKAEDPSARRFIVSFDASTTVMVEGIEFVKCEVVGQSFMLHQIRKMMGLAVAVMRNFAPESLLGTALQKNINITVPTAPEVGLYLDECFFTSYNNKWNHSHEEVSMEAFAAEAEEFKMKHIYSHIASTENKEGAVGLWLHSLNFRNYPDLQGEKVLATDDPNLHCERVLADDPDSKADDPELRGEEVVADDADGEKLAADDEQAVKVENTSE